MIFYLLRRLRWFVSHQWGCWRSLMCGSVTQSSHYCSVL